MLKTEIILNVRKIVNSSKSVKINASRFDRLVEHAKKLDYLPSTPFENFKYRSDKDKLEFIFLFAVINFCFWNFENPSGTSKILNCLYSFYQNHNDFSIKKISSLSFKEFKYIFKGENLLLVHERHILVKELQFVLETKYKDSVNNIFTYCGNDTELFIKTLVNDIPSFNDISVVGDIEIPFFKRIQVLTSQILNTPEFNHLLRPFELTAFADYRLPQVLRELGILEYSTELAAKIDNNQLILKDSAEEIEIRCNTIAAIENAKDFLNSNYNLRMNSASIDYLIWNMSRTLQNMKPHHKTITIFY
jgi:hypothetical protein